MKPSNLDKIHNSFSIQAEAFENKTMSFSKQEYLEYTINKINANPTDNVLEVAAGTGVCGRAIAPFVEQVICLDATPAMLQVGRDSAKEQQLHNIDFVEGYAEALPFEEESFDVVLTRLSFHHFTEMEAPFSEMYRVLKPNGKLVVIDMEATSEELREVEDKIETMRDYSHVKNRSRQELLSIYEDRNLEIVACESTKIPVKLDAWMNLTHTPDKVQKEIITLMKNDIIDKKKTGFKPYLKDDQIYFDQRWLLIIGKKSRA